MTDLIQRASTASPVECLGQTFPNDEARRAHYLGLLAEKLKDPAFREAGFPSGNRRSHPGNVGPTVLHGLPESLVDPTSSSTMGSRTTLTTSTSESRWPSMYRWARPMRSIRHMRTTRILLIVPSILHYTKPGDVVLDGFAGSGMTGVAAQWCGAAPAAYRHELELAWKKERARGTSNGSPTRRAK